MWVGDASGLATLGICCDLLPPWMQQMLGSLRKSPPRTLAPALTLPHLVPPCRSWAAWRWRPRPPAPAPWVTALTWESCTCGPWRRWVVRAQLVWPACLSGVGGRLVPPGLYTQLGPSIHAHGALVFLSGLPGPT